MKKITLLVVFSMLTLMAVVVLAGTKQNNQNSQTDSTQDKRQINSRVVLYNNLSMAIDYWHDASLKGNKKLIAEKKRIIFEIISNDIKDCYQAISYAKLETSYLQDADNKTKNKIQPTQLQYAENSLGTKNLLFTALKKSISFAYSYRLFADYLQILKEEIAVEKIEVAEATLKSENVIKK